MSTTGCGGCNDGCLDESVQLQQGAQGETGADGADGAEGPEGPQGRHGTTVIDVDVSNIETSQTSFSATNKTMIVPIGILNALKNYVEIEGFFVLDTFNAIGAVQFNVNGTTVDLGQISTVDEVYFGNGGFGGLHIKLRLTKTALQSLIPTINSNIFTHNTSNYSIPRITGSVAEYSAKTTTITGIDMTSAVTITMKMKTTTGNIKCFDLRLTAYTT